MGALYDYISGLWKHWVYFMTGGPFVAEQITKQIFPKYDDWLRNYISATVRNRVMIGFAIIGMFAATFSAFNDERSLKLVAQSRFSDQTHNSDADTVMASGSDQKTATPVTANYSLVLPSAERSGVILQPTGRRPLTVKNTGKNILLVYPPTGTEINDLGINMPVILINEATFVCMNAVRCIT